MVLRPPSSIVRKNQYSGLTVGTNYSKSNSYRPHRSQTLSPTSAAYSSCNSAAAVRLSDKQIGL